MPQLIASVQGVEVKHVYLTKAQTTLGRSPGNDIVLDNMVVSGKHCRFELEGIADIWLRDLGSTNGTYVNDHMLKARTLLHDGDVIAIGPFRIRYLQASEQPSGFGQTSAMPADAAPAHAFFQVQTGTSAGLEVPIVKAVTTFGKPGIAVVSVSHRRGGYFVTHLTGPSRPLLNNEPLGDEAQLLQHMDVLELAGTRMIC
ncbi:FHA domain-containing protein [Ramlibacter sp.]|uniref:FHA domain-containing protein n=1 Tax=Ramlibacter sp. TaxID=1917967 RepID=UPI003D0D723A